MPMGAPEDFGTEADGSASEDYCTHCYQNGAFTWPDATLERMVDFCAGIMAKSMDITVDEAKAKLSESMPKLKRWREKA